MFIDIQLCLALFKKKKKNMIKPCPRCGGNRFLVHGIMKGPAISYYDEHGVYQELDLDRCYWESQSKSVRCENCLKIRKDVYLDDGIIREL